MTEILTLINGWEFYVERRTWVDAEVLRAEGSWNSDTGPKDVIELPATSLLCVKGVEDV